MLLTSIVLFASSATAFSIPNVSSVLPLFARKDGGSGSSSGSGSGSGTCPPVWKEISAELTQQFLTGGECNPDARAAIRLIFHDCGGKFIIAGHQMSEY